MPVLDIFNQDAFRTIAMSEAISKVDRVPSQIGDMNIFNEHGIRAETVMIESRDSSLSVIPTSKRGAPTAKRSTEKRQARDFRTVRVAKSDRIMASELAFIRQMGEESAVMGVQDEISRRLNGPEGLLSELEMTLENMRLGAVQGVVQDSDDSTIYDYFSEFGISAATEIDFSLNDAADGAFRENVEKSVVMPMRRLAKGLRYPFVQALVGEQFWHDMMKNAEVRASYLAQVEARELRNGTMSEVFNYGGVRWEYYDGSDDGSSIAVDTNKVRFFPAGMSGAFETVFAPGESFADIGQVGLPVYVKVIPDDKRDSFVDIEIYSYPLHIARRPDLLFSGRRV
jgi:hypothetical protein